MLPNVCLFFFYFQMTNKLMIVFMKETYLLPTVAKQNMALVLLLSTNQAVILKLEKTGNIIYQSQKPFYLKKVSFWLGLVTFLLSVQMKLDILMGWAGCDKSPPLICKGTFVNTCQKYYFSQLPNDIHLQNFPIKVLHTLLICL